MEQRLTPELFYGSAIATLIGLAFGLSIHAPWRPHPGGPQIVWSSSAADTQTSNAAARAPALAMAAQENRALAPVAPLPVTRLAPQMFDVQPAAAEETEREDVGDVVADAAPQPGNLD